MSEQNIKQKKVTEEHQVYAPTYKKFKNTAKLNHLLFRDANVFGVGTEKSKKKKKKSNTQVRIMITSERKEKGMR